MKKFFLLIGYGFLVMGLTGCAQLQKIIPPVLKIETVKPPASLPAYSGPKARIAVVEFEVKAAKATAEIGSGLREMLVTVLVNSNRFLVVERQELGTLDLIITTAVTEFEPELSGGRGGLGGGGGVGSGMLGGLLGTALNKAHMGLDIRIMDTSTSKILAATCVQGQASDVGGAILSGLFGKNGLGKGLSAYVNTPMEKAIRICIIETARYMSQVIPASYYKY